MNIPVSSFTFIVPALNEEKNLPAVATAIASAAQSAGVVDYEIIIVDDGSADGTADVAKALCLRYPEITMLRHDSPQGVGKSFLSGVAVASKDYSLIVPGDNEFDLGFLAKAVPHLPPGGGDFIVTYVENPEVRPYIRRFLSVAYIAFFNLLFSTDFKYTNGIVIYPSEWIRSAALRSSGYTFQSEALLLAHGEKKRFVQLGMKMRPRRYGRSKAFSPRAIWEVVRSLLRMKFERARRDLNGSDK